MSFDRKVWQSAFVTLVLAWAWVGALRAGEAPPSSAVQQREVFGWNQDIVVAKGQDVESVLVVNGNAEVQGTSRDVAMVVNGDLVIGPGAQVKDAVTFGGDIRVAGRVDVTVVAFGGNVELLPGASVGGDVAALGGKVTRAEGVTLNEEKVQVTSVCAPAAWETVKHWAMQTLARGRLLAFSPESAWAWALAGALLLFYSFLALLMPKVAVRCAESLEQQPGRTLLATVLTAILLPVSSFLLLVTLVGIPLALLVPPVLIVVGKVGLLVAVGRRFGLQSPMVAVVVGGLILILLYTVPFVGILFFLVATHLGCGMAVHAGLRSLADYRANGARKARAAEVQQTSAPSSVLPPALASGPGAAVDTPSPTLEVAAGFGSRLGAFLIDAIIVFVLTSILGTGHLLLMFGLYSLAFWRWRGATVGGIVMGHRLVRSEGGPLDFGVLLIRLLGGYLSFICAGLGFLWILFDAERLAWHDRIAGTRVLRRKTSS